VDPRRSTTDIPPPQSAALGLHPVARRLLLIILPHYTDPLRARSDSSVYRLFVFPSSLYKFVCRPPLENIQLKMWFRGLNVLMSKIFEKNSSANHCITESKYTRVRVKFAS